MIMTTLHTPEQLYANADELLLAAENELQHDQGAIATHLVCNNARLSITHYLIGFLLKHQIPIKSPASIASLQQQCQLLDPRFHTLDLDNISCRYDTPGQRFCLEVDKVSACFIAAHQLRSIVTAPTN